MLRAGHVSSQPCGSCALATRTVIMVDSLILCIQSSNGKRIVYHDAIFPPIEQRRYKFSVEVLEKALQSILPT